MASGAIERGEKVVCYSRLELPPHHHERLRAAAAREDRSAVSYIRRAVLDRIAADESRAAEGIAGSHEPLVHAGSQRPGPK
jgi:hypothetical protein